MRKYWSPSRYYILVTLILGPKNSGLCKEVEENGQWLKNEWSWHTSDPRENKHDKKRIKTQWLKEDHFRTNAVSYILIVESCPKMTKLKEKVFLTLCQLSALFFLEEKHRFKKSYYLLDKYMSESRFSPRLRHDVLQFNTFKFMTNIGFNQIHAEFISW